MVGCHHRLNGSKFEQTRGVDDGKGDLVAAVHGVAELDMTEWKAAGIFIELLKVKVAHSCPTLCDSPWNSPGQNTGVGSLLLLQQIFPTQESNWGLLHCRQIFYQLSYQGSHGAP